MNPISIKDLDLTPRREVFPSPRDWRDQFLYQLLLDRFDDNGESPPFRRETSARGRNLHESHVFQGGNLKGVTRRLDYIKNLGCTAIWISPPFKQNQSDPTSYHGYGIQNFLAVDPRFGTLEDLRELVRQAHARGMYIILDIVINHTADCFSYKGRGPHHFKKRGKFEFGHWHRAPKVANHNSPLGIDDAVWPVELQDPDCFSRRGAIRNHGAASDDEAIHGDFYVLKDLDLANPKVMEVTIQCFKYWIAAADIDGYRIDTVRNMPPAAAVEFCAAIHDFARAIGKNNFILIGELVGDDDLLHKFTCGRNPVMDACLDFPLYGIAEEILKGEKPASLLRDRYETFKKYYREPEDAGRHYVTFLDNHDQVQRPFRRFLHGAHDDRLGIMGIGFLLTNLGIPCIYYGTEQGFDSGGDRDHFVRECMFGGKWGAFDTTGAHFFNDKHPIYLGIAALAKIRHEQPALRYGEEHFCDISDDGKYFSPPEVGKCTLAYTRVWKEDVVLVAINLDIHPRKDFVAMRSLPGDLMIDLQGGPAVRVANAAVRVPLLGREIRIFKISRGDAS